MTSAEKKDIYVLLKAADDWLHGYGAPDFYPQAAEHPDSAFQSDVEVMAEPSTACIRPAEQEKAQPQTALTPGGAAGITLESIASKICQCHNCALAQRRIQAVPGEGVRNPYVMVIGEGPGEDEDKTGRPFVGKAGQLLDKMLAAINLDRSCNCFIANIVKCRPPQNRTPFPEEAAACSGYLQAQIHLLKPKMILAMGRTAVQSLLQTSQGINALRGRFFTYNDIPLLATYHPSALLRNVDLKRPAWEDLKAFRARLQELCPGYDAAFLALHQDNR